MKKKICSIFLVAVVLCTMLCVGVSAQEYSTEYPAEASYNSGSPLWLHCEIDGMGEYLIVIDPNTHPQSFGFDSPTGYNLINNTGSAIYGRAYKVGASEGYSAVWYSYYCLSLKTGQNAAGAYTSYEAYKITEIYGTTLDLIDYRGDRGNDAFKYDMDDADFRLLISVCVVLIVFLVVCSLIFKQRLFRM